MVMEFLEGSDLSQRVRSGGPLPIAEAVDCVVQAAEALGVAHSLGIVHRDVKPANLFLTQRPDGSPCVKVLDFGISKMKPPGGGPDLTRTQGMMGSPLYMSPEQLSSAKDVDGRADVYALGCVLFELLVGRVPFEAEDLPQLVVKILHQPPPSLRALRPEIPPALEEAVTRALVKDRSQRLASVGDLARLVAPFGTPTSRMLAERVSRLSGDTPLPVQPLPQVAPTMPDLGISAPAASFSATSAQPPVRGFPVIPAIVVALLVAGGGAFFVLRSGGPPAQAIAPSSSTSSSVAPARVHVDVRVEPPSGWLQIDDGERVIGRIVREVAIDGKKHVLRAGGEGRQSAELTFEGAPPPATVTLASAPVASSQPSVTAKAPVVVAAPLPKGKLPLPTPSVVVTKPSSGTVEGKNGSKIIVE
jgi:serine/threonine-protein kinase